jgi:phage head maturation protease
MTDNIFALAAERRAEAMNAPADRPRERRMANGLGAPAEMRSIVRTIVTRSADDEPVARIGGYASITETPYQMYDAFGPYNEVVSRDAFTRTLSTKPMVEFTVNHGEGGALPMAHTRNGTLILNQDKTGLGFEATVDPRRSDVNNLLLALARGDMGEASFKFRIDSGVWSSDYSEFRIEQVDLERGDVSSVNFGANPHAYSQARSMTQRALDPQDVNMLTQALAWFSAIDLIVDQAQTALSEYLGVPNPDEDDEMSEPAPDTDAEPVLDETTGLALAKLPPAAAMSLLELLAM